MEVFVVGVVDQVDGAEVVVVPVHLIVGIVLHPDHESFTAISVAEMAIRVASIMIEKIKREKL